MSAVLQKLQASNQSTFDLSEKFAGRQSAELIIGFAGPIGCGIKVVVDNLEDRLRERGYSAVVRIKLSDFLRKLLDDGRLTEPDVPQGSAPWLRYRRLQEAGKELRKRTKTPAVLAEYAIQEIAVHRQQAELQRDPNAVPGETIVPQRVAYLIDQLKRPEEVALLRTIYKNLFFLVGVTRVYDKRADALLQEHLKQEEVHSLMEIDRAEGGPGGQQLDKTLHLADYFIRNDATTIEDKKSKVNRLLDLIHGDKSVTPTHEEAGMYAAYCAGLRSACLSRQVGAAIAARTGEVLATGCNDVPQSGGGLYSSSSPTDHRCVHMDGQQCFNDSHKRHLKDEIGQVLKDATGTALTEAQREEALSKIYENTRLRDLIEFSRSVHAEMDAIVSLARIGGRGIEGASLFTTTFPCHSCARHIVAAGISKVYYIEPYEKSMAKELHSDSIAFDANEAQQSHVAFLHFEGVAPRQFNGMFRAVGRKDNSGKFIPIRAQEADKGVPEYLDNYQDFEKKAVEHFNEMLSNWTDVDKVDSISKHAL